ncbi:unnamed protein product [Brassica napus]|uniref:(rape) hypothetical protein n=1 Tax=Brassica napus TaxID=3708 RepID=A0A816SJT9_BRANA|nr:unnamed protein product [Brassica napus]
MSTTGRERLFGPPVFKGAAGMHRTPRDVRRFQGGQAVKQKR